MPSEISPETMSAIQAEILSVLQGVPFFNESSGRPFLTDWQIKSKVMDNLSLPRERSSTSALSSAFVAVNKLEHVESVVLCLDGLNVTHDDGVNLIMNAALYRWVD